MATRDLQCPNGCPDGRFEALNAPLVVDRAGRYVSHDASRATFVCARCQGVAVDVAAAAREMERDHRYSGDLPDVLTCPGCGTEMLPPEDDPLAALLECPMCGQRFSPEEGRGRLLGGRVQGEGWDADGEMEVDGRPG